MKCGLRGLTDTLISSSTKKKLSNRPTPNPPIQTSAPPSPSQDVLANKPTQWGGCAPLSPKIPVDSKHSERPQGLESKPTQWVYFVGIGGQGMSSLAEVLLARGVAVQGSDLRLSERTQQLQAMGAVVHQGHHASHVIDAACVVVSSAIPSDNVEVQAAHKAKIPVVTRGKMLANLMDRCRSIAVTGSHGKSTTTGLIGYVLRHAGLNPTVILGGALRAFCLPHLVTSLEVSSLPKPLEAKGRSPPRSGWGVVEADESDGSFLHLHPEIVVLTHVDREHVDYWHGGVKHLQRALVEFANGLPKHGFLVGCWDIAAVREVMEQVQCRWISYGLGEGAHYRATHVQQQGLRLSFNVWQQREKTPRELGQIHLPLAGQHNVCNALAAIATADVLQVPFEKTQAALAQFPGVLRRLNVMGEADGVTVMDDYAHHPTEIRATLQAVRSAFPKRRIVALFQPHRHSRTKALLSDFAACFGHADIVLITDTYGAGEALQGVSAAHMAAAVRCQGHPQVHYAGDVQALQRQAVDLRQAGDVLLTLGAGHCMFLLAQALRDVKPVRH